MNVDLEGGETLVSTALAESLPVQPFSIRLCSGLFDIDRSNR